MDEESKPYTVADLIKDLDAHFPLDAVITKLDLKAHSATCNHALSYRVPGRLRKAARQSTYR